MSKKIKPIKIKKKDKMCINCIFYDQRRCSLFSKEEIPYKVLIKGCKKYKKNKRLYF